MATPPPSTIAGGATFGLTVMAEDSQGNADPTFTGKVTLVLASGPSGGILGGTTTQTVQTGTATFSDLTLNTAGSI